MFGLVTHIVYIQSHTYLYVSNKRTEQNAWAMSEKWRHHSTQHHSFHIQVRLLWWAAWRGAHAKVYVVMYILIYRIEKSVQKVVWHRVSALMNVVVVVASVTAAAAFNLCFRWTFTSSICLSFLFSFSCFLFRFSTPFFSRYFPYHEHSWKFCEPKRFSFERLSCTHNTIQFKPQTLILITHIYQMSSPP